MCGRFTLANPAAAFNAMPWLTNVPKSHPRYNIAPGQRALIICDHSGPAVRLAHWGFTRKRGSLTRDLLINARSEKVLETPSFSESFRQRRCVIPADGFYEWRKTANASIPHLFQLTSGEPFCLAGLYDRVGDELNFVILTTAANALVKPVHARMPVMLPVREAMAYISAPPEAAETRRFFQPFASEQMRSHRVSTLVNRIENDSPACIQSYAPPSGAQGALFS